MAPAVWLATVLSIQPDSPLDPANDTLVYIAVAKGDPLFDDPAFSSALESHFAGSGLTPDVVVRPGANLMARMAWASTVARQPAVHAVFWLQPVGEQHRVYLMAPDGERVWVRSAVQSNDRELVWEATGIMLRTLASGLTDDAPIGMQAAPPPPKPAEPPAPPQPTPAPSVEPPPSPAFTLAVHYVGQNFDAAVPWQSGAGGRIDVQLPLGVFVGLSSAFIPVARLDEAIGLEVRRVPVSLSSGYRFRPDKALRPEVGLAAVAEVFWWSVSDGPMADGQPGTTGRFALAPLAGLRWRFWKGLGMHLRVRADLWVVNVDLVSETTDGRRSRVRPHAVSATVQAGLQYTF